jgi:hypothetical protein
MSVNLEEKRSFKDFNIHNIISESKTFDNETEELISKLAFELREIE